jgi:hypothetical protein
VRILTAAVVGLCLVGGRAAAQDRVELAGLIDLRLVHSTGAESYIEGGPGLLRFDSTQDGLHLGEAVLSGKFRIADTLNFNLLASTFGDHNNAWGALSEAYLDYRPFPTGPWRFRVKLGAFHMPISLEHRGVGWTTVYSLTPSAINTWMGEEFRTIGAEGEARWRDLSGRIPGDFALVAGVYGWNDPAGVLLADRGFALSDRSSTVFGHLSVPPLDFYREIDHRAGAYGGASWRRGELIELRALHYDNRADPGAHDGQTFAWRTRFTSWGARFEPGTRFTFIAQYIEGATFVGPDSAGDGQFKMDYHAAFALASVEFGPGRLTARYDDFDTKQLRGYYGPPSDQTGHAWTVAWLQQLGQRWELCAEWMQVRSTFPPRIEYNNTNPSLTETLIQAAVRYHFRWHD